MSDRPPHQSPGTARKFVPSVNPLESRLLLSQQVFFPDGSHVVFPLFTRLPRTGGTALQSGTALTVGVGQHHDQHGSDPGRRSRQHQRGMERASGTLIHGRRRDTPPDRQRPGAIKSLST